MATVPAFCDSCHTAFSTGFDVGQGATLSFTNCIAGPCPRCGGMGQIPDGVFRSLGQTLLAFATSKKSAEDLERLLLILKAAKGDFALAEQAVERIRNDVPALEALLSTLPANRSEWYAFLAVLLAMVQVYVAINPPTSAPTQQITINQVVQQVLAPEERSSSKSAPRKATKQTGRNEACPCGSGVKYKKCCLGKN